MWMAAGVVLAAIATLLQVTTTGPRVTVRWRAGISDAERGALERQYDLRKGEAIEGTDTGWRYELHGWSRDNVEALVHDPAVADTGYIDREAFTTEPPQRRVSVRSLPMPFPFSVSRDFRDPWQVFQLQSLCLLLGGAIVFWAAHASSERRRRNMAIAALLAVGVMAWTLPISGELVTMGDANQEVQTRRDFEQYAGVDHVRFEAHLSYVIMGRLDRLFGATEASPERAQITLARGATAWFVLCALATGFMGRWSPHVLRYLGLALVAPSALLYFGWREVGYLSLNVAMFPLLERGLRDGSWRIEGASALAGLGAALHGWGLVSLAGAWIAALAAPAPAAERVGRVLRIAAWGAAAYTGWVAVYIIVLKLPVGLGHVVAIPWRPVFTTGVFDGRINAAIFSARGSRDLFMAGWVTGAPLLIVAATLWRQCGDEVRVALSYSVPSVLIALFVLHSQGLSEDMDVVFAVFPAFYALAWVCALDLTRTKIAAALLVSGHLAFWRTVLDEQFRNAPIN
jgi:hypothetical protein